MFSNYKFKNLMLNFFLYCLVSSDPVDDVNKFKEKYEEKYGSQHPTFYLGSYGQVRCPPPNLLRLLA